MTIYTTPQAKTDVFPVGASDLEEQLNWEAVNVVVDNPTTWWLYFPAAKRYVPPGVMAQVVPLSGSTSVQASWQAPAGFIQGVEITGQAATLVWLSPGIAPPSAGLAATVTAQQPSTLLLAGVEVPADGEFHDLGVKNLPAGTQSLCFVWFNNFVSLNDLSLVGENTGEDWTNLPAIIQPPLYFAIDSSIDPAIDVSVNFGTIGGSDTVKVWLSALLTTQVPAPDAGTPTAVVIKSPNSSGYVETETGTDALQRLAVSMLAAEPAPWQSPNATHDTGNASVGVGGTVVAVPAATGGKDNWLHWANLAVGTASQEVQLVGAMSGKVLATVFPGVANQPIWSKNFKGGKLGNLTGSIGEELNWKNTGSSAQFVSSQIDYTQA